MQSKISLGAAAMLTAAAALLSVTVLQQLPGRLYARLRAHDHFAFVPNWSFFAPNPATRDYEPLHRFVYRDGSYSQWSHTLESRERKVLDNLWAPNRRLSKAIFDITSDLLPLIHERDIDLIETVPAYTALREYIKRLARSSAEPNIVAVQFLVVLHGGYDDSLEPEILFVSKEHSVLESE